MFISTIRLEFGKFLFRSIAWEKLIDHMKHDVSDVLGLD